MSEMKLQPSEKDWREIAERTAKETNPQKLVRMVEELCGALDQRNQQNQSVPHQSRNLPDSCQNLAKK